MVGLLFNSIKITETADISIYAYYGIAILALLSALPERLSNMNLYLKLGMSKTEPKTGTETETTKNRTKPHHKKPNQLITEPNKNRTTNIVAV